MELSLNCLQFQYLISFKFEKKKMKITKDSSEKPESSAVRNKKNCVQSQASSHNFVCSFEIKFYRKFLYKLSIVFFFMFSNAPHLCKDKYFFFRKYLPLRVNQLFAFDKKDILTKELF